MRHHIIGGSYIVSFGVYAFYPCLLKISVSVPKELIRVEDYASDATVILLVPLKLVNNLIGLNSIDVGNCFVTILSLVFFKIISRELAVIRGLCLSGHHSCGSLPFITKEVQLLKKIGTRQWRLYKFCFLSQVVMCHSQGIIPLSPMIMYME